MKLTLSSVAVLAALVAASPSHSSARERAAKADRGTGGASTTVSDTSHNAFGRALNNLDPAHWQPMLEGKAVFAHRFRPAGEGPPGLDGLGPLYNADSCTSCHFKDGRGRRPDEPPAPQPPLIFRLGSPAGSAEAWRGDSTLGAQLQVRGVGVVPEGWVEVAYRFVNGRFPKGGLFELRQPVYRPILGASESGASPRLSPRIPPTLVGMGLIEAVDPTEVLSRADADDTDGDGVSGRPRWIPTREGRRLGRFGWKAGEASLESQVVSALAEDLGVNRSEIAPAHLERLVLYLRLLAPPARRRPEDPEVLRGEELFGRIGCEACHRAELATAGRIEGPQELVSQRLQPYTDLLLHDMGADLAAGFPEEDAGEREWRTAPLWGLGLLATVNGEAYFLHDGRARSFEEAILWHGGEALASRDRFVALSVVERSALIRFLASL